MKPVSAITNPFKPDDVREALASIGVAGLTTIEVPGFGRRRGHTETSRGADNVVECLPKVERHDIVDDSEVVSVSEATAGAAQTGRIVNDKRFLRGRSRPTRPYPHGQIRNQCP